MKKSNVVLSVVLAVHNEAEVIARCLKSVVDLADEIIVVDGESTDNTVQIARKFNSNVITTSNKSNFHINKQMAMDAAHGRLVLQLDADEVVDGQLQAFVQQQKKRVANLSVDQLASLQPRAWWLKRRNFFMGRFLSKGGQYPDPVIRFYLNGSAKLPQKDVHEQMEVSGEVGSAEGHLLHYSTPNLSVYLRKANTYTSFTARQLSKAGIRPSMGLAIKYVFFKPIATFFTVYLRHRGYVDGIPGFGFALLSAWHHPLAVLKLWELSQPTSHPVPTTSGSSSRLDSSVLNDHTPRIT